VINGVGELTAKLEIDERGIIETPVYLCGSHAVGTVFQAAVLASGRGPDNIVLPVVGECDDGDMADSRMVSICDVDGALQALGDDVAEGSVGAGTGMVAPRRLVRRRGVGRDRPPVHDLGRPGPAHRAARPLLRGRLRGGSRGRLQLPGRGAAGAAPRRHDAERLPAALTGGLAAA
jgi:hypothetical protein